MEANQKSFMQNDMITWLLEEAEEHQREVSNLAMRLLRINFAGLLSTSLVSPSLRIGLVYFMSLTTRTNHNTDALTRPLPPRRALGRVRTGVARGSGNRRCQGGVDEGSGGEDVQAG